MEMNIFKRLFKRLFKKKKPETLLDIVKYLEELDLSPDIKTFTESGKHVDHTSFAAGYFNAIGHVKELASDIHINPIL